MNDNATGFLESVTEFSFSKDETVKFLIPYPIWYANNTILTLKIKVQLSFT